MGPLLLPAIVTLCVCVVAAAITRGGWSYRIPCAVVGLWLGAVLAVPLGALVAVVTLATDQHFWQLGYAVPSSVAALTCLGLLALTYRVGRHFRTLNLAARRQRRRHEILLDLFASSRPDLGQVNVIPDTRLFAYSVPCVISGRIILSQGTLDLLDPPAIRAVLAHERAHLLVRHHLVLQLAEAIAATFPRLRSAVALPDRITEIVEMSADCFARRRVGQQPTINALTSLAHMTVPAGALGAGGRAVALRLAHLRSRRNCCEDPRSKGAYAMATLLVSLPAAVGVLNEMIDLCFWGTS